MIWLLYCAAILAKKAETLQNILSLFLKLECAPGRRTRNARHFGGKEEPRFRRSRYFRNSMEAVLK
jgi:hypothetical protein